MKIFNILMFTVISLLGVNVSATTINFPPKKCTVIVDTDIYVKLETKKNSIYWINTHGNEPAAFCKHVMKQSYIHSYPRELDLCYDYRAINDRVCKVIKINTIHVSNPNKVKEKLTPEQRLDKLRKIIRSDKKASST